MHIWWGVLQVGDQSIISDDPPRNLGVIFNHDTTRSLAAHVVDLYRSFNFNPYSVGKVRKYLDRPRAENIINDNLAWIIVTAYHMEQTIPRRPTTVLQNNAASIISKRCEFDHISLLLKELHWLPVELRIIYENLLLTKNTLKGHAPQYLTAWASYQIRKIKGCACAGNAGRVSPADDFKGNR